MTALYWKTLAGVLVGVVLILTVQKQEKDMALLLGILVMAAGAMAAMTVLEPVLDFLWRLEQLGNFSSDALKALLKMVGIGLTAELAGLICQDSGNASLGKVMHLVGAAMILLLSLPVFETFLQLVQQILGEL